MWRNNIQYVAAISGGSVAYQWRMSMCQCQCQRNNQLKSMA
jgi:hypothetical protein